LWASIFHATHRVYYEKDNRQEDRCQNQAEGKQEEVAFSTRLSTWVAAFRGRYPFYRPKSNWTKLAASKNPYAVPRFLADARRREFSRPTHGVWKEADFLRRQLLGIAGSDLHDLGTSLSAGSVYDSDDISGRNAA
jgi:hypothetical protein